MALENIFWKQAVVYAVVVAPALSPGNQQL